MRLKDFKANVNYLAPDHLNIQTRYSRSPRNPTALLQLAVEVAIYAGGEREVIEKIIREKFDEMTKTGNKHI